MTRLRSLLVALPLLGALAAAAAPPATSPRAAIAGTTARDADDRLRVADPDSPLSELELVEDLSEEVADRFLGFADKLRRRDWEAAGAWLTEGFRGQSFAGATIAKVEPLHLGATRTRYEVSTAPVADRAGFLGGLAEVLEPWSRVDGVLWKVKGAEFQQARDRWGKVHFQAKAQGDLPGGGHAFLVAWCWAKVVRVRGEWFLDQVELESLSIERMERPLFTEVGAAAGVAHAGIRFGQPGNESFAWNGAAGADLDADGLWDLFVPSRPRSFVYLRDADGGYREAARELGLGGVAGGTGPAFFDFDNDGDQDLALADVGWTEQDGSSGGSRLRFFENRGSATEPKFVERGAELGFALQSHGHSLTVLDYDNDGWLDVFVANYGRPQGEPNNSWTNATNGQRNFLFRNRGRAGGGAGFEEVGERAGLTETRWSYACSSLDYDLDGDADLHVANDYGVNQLYRNDGDGTFTEVADDLGVADLGNGMGSLWGDLDSDGVLDLYSVNMSSTAGTRILRRMKDGEDVTQLKRMASGNRVYLARGEPGSEGFHFAEQDTSLGGIGGSWAWSTVATDLDLDGRTDLFCTNGFITGDTFADT